MAAPDRKPQIHTIVIAGPTASGKSAVALELAKKIDGEIVNADSRQIYRFLDAGTSKPGEDERKMVPHHLYDFLDPAEIYSTGRFVRDAGRVLSEIHGRGNRAIVAGGTGLYLRGLFEGLAEMPERDPETRKELEAFAEAQGRKALHDRLKAVDPAAAEKIPHQNIQRVIRALEVHALTGERISELHRKPRPAARFDSRTAFFGLDWDREALKKRIRSRSERILPSILSETERLLAMGYDEDCPGLQSLGYGKAAACLAGKISRRDLPESLILDTWHYAKRQLTWFRRDPKIRWIPMTDPFSPAETAENIAKEIIV